MEHANQSPTTPVAPADRLFGDTLRQLRRAAGLTQAELAERAHLSPRGLSDLERGINRSPRRETLLALAHAFELAGEDRQSFFAAARRHPAGPSVSGDPSVSTPHEPDAEPVDQPGQTPVIQVFLIADVRGYTLYTYEHRDEDAAQLAMRFAAIAGAAVQTYSGQVLEVRGDEVLAVFTSARSALRAAIALQEQVAQTSHTTPEQPIRCGIGLEAGEAIPVAGGYRGLAINLAARLCAQAGPGEVLAGETVIGLARKVDGLHFQDRGVASLKGFPEPVRITQVLVAEPPQVPEEPGASMSRAEQVLPVPGEREPVARRAVGNDLSAQPRLRLVARETEMARLLATLNAVQEGTGRLVVVVGEPGVGKTRLAQEVLQAAQQRGFVGITGRCYAPQETVPYYPFLESLARAYATAPLAIRTALPEQWPEVARLIPDRRLAVPESPAAQLGSGGADDQQRLFWQITRFLEALAEARPLALLLDDLHWMDGASLQLLLHLARNSRASPLLLLGTYRDSEVPLSHPLAAGLRDLGRAQLVERIELRPLPREGTAALLAAMLEEGEVSEAVTDVIYGPTEGNAFFVQEVLRALVERGDITLQSDCWQTRPEANIVVPESIRAAVLERVGRLSPTAQEILGLASVLGQTFRFDDLLSTWTLLTPAPATVAGGSHGAGAVSTSTELETTLEAALEEAVRAQVVREVGQEQHGFSHALAQRALYEQLSARRRRRLHRVAAESIERLPKQEHSRRVSELVYHFQQAEASARALPYMLQEGEQTLAVYAYSEAECQFRTAQALAHQLGDADRAAMAAEHLGTALWWQLRYDEAFLVLESVAAEAERRGNLAGLVRVACLLSDVANRRGTPTAGIDRLLRLIETIRAEGPNPDLIRLYISLGTHYLGSDQYGEMLDVLEQALRAAQVVDDASLVAEVQMWYGYALFRLGRLEEAQAEFLAALPVLEQRDALEDLQNRALALCGLGFVLGYLGQMDEAQRYCERALAVDERMKAPDGVALTATYCGLWAFIRGQWPTAQSYIERAAALRPQLDTSSMEDATIYWIQGMVQLAKGQVAAANESARAGLSVAEQSNDLRQRRRLQQLLAELDLQRGDPAAARRRLSALLDRTGLVELPVNELLPLLILAHLELGEVEAAEALATQTMTRLRTQHDRLTLVDALRVQAAVRTRQARWGEAETVLAEALALARAMPYPYAEAKALSTYGDLMVATGQPAQAREHYIAALAVLQPLGEVPYTERIQQALAKMLASSQAQA